jgi:hypothetical protein
MSTQPSATGHAVMLKVTFLKQPQSGVAATMTSGGVWFDSLELASAVQRELSGVGPKAVPPEKQFLKNRKLMFVPFSQIEWILSDHPF